MRPWVLLADDSAPIRRVVSNALEGVDLDLSGVVDEASALKALERGSPDLILIDLHLPPEGVRGFMQRAGGRLSGVPVVVLMNPLDDFDHARGRRMGAAGVFIKPFDPVTLIELVARYCPSAWDGLPPPQPQRDPGSVAMERIRQEVLSVAPGFTGLEASPSAVEAAIEKQVSRLFSEEGLHPQIELALKQMLREELVRILPGVVEKVVRERIAQIEAEARRDQT